MSHNRQKNWCKLAPKPFLITRIDYNPSVIWISPKNSTCLSGKLRTKITSLIEKSTSPGLSDTTFFAHWISLFSAFNRVSFFMGSLEQGVNIDRVQSTCEVPTFVFSNLIQSMISKLCAKWDQSYKGWQKGKMSLNGQRLKASGTHVKTIPGS